MGATVAGKPPPQRGMFALALFLAALAGWVDGLGFVHWNGLFVSFMSGNTTQAGASASWSAAAKPGQAIAVFVAGVVIGEGLARWRGARCRAAVLLAETLLLWVSVVLHAREWSEALISILLGLAMGIQNASVHEAGGISVALTYVTGTLVKVGRGIAAALAGSGRWIAIAPNLGLWSALLSGAFAGAQVTRASEATSLLVPALTLTIVCAVTAVAARRAERAGPT